MQHGTPRQREAHETLQILKLWQTLADFGPVLAGTVPLNIDVPGSDLDVLCEVHPLMEAQFSAVLRAQYGHLPGFCLRRTTIGGLNCTISTFFYLGTEIEVFGQAVPAVQQRAFRHMVVEHAILQAGGEAWRQAVQHLKTQGLKTEPAFAALLHLPGDPYEALLTLEDKTPAELQALLARHPLS
ncbi:MAG TPA: DUF4269 domain-containing protein [Hymenobacter sp.]|uniref:DUF4269 domain-containing protein n=1 Tax=Hymenobacter sp. TaxID=1898978 RepID=UPI002EDA2400